MRLFGTSGIRRLWDRSLLDLAVKVGLAVGEAYGAVVMGTDTRTSSDSLKHAFISGLLAAGGTCEDAGIVPTPTLAFTARDFAAGVMITASHNPPQYNGIKLLNPDGSAFNRVQQERIERAISNDSLSVSGWDEVKQSCLHQGAVERHIERILRDFPGSLKLKVALDCGCGAASVITPRLLEKMGCEVETINCTASGFFPRGIEPIESNLQELITLTRESGADVGIAHDGDADRMMTVDDKGRFVPGDRLLFIFAQEMGAADIVTTIDASMTIEDTGYHIRRTMIGDNYVSEELKNGGEFGGEPSGSWVFPRLSLCPDGIYAAAWIAAIASREKLSRLVDNIPDYPLLRGSIDSEGVEASRLESQLVTLGPLSISKIDGIKLYFNDGWLLVRASGTEPKIRLTAEAKTETRVHQLYDEGIKVIQDCRKEKVS
jgi:phosphoglucosamine mutase